MVSRYNGIFMKGWPESDPIVGPDVSFPNPSTPTPSISSLTNNLTNLSISPEPSPPASNPIQLTARDTNSLAYLSGLKLMFQLFNSGLRPEQIQRYFAAQGKFFPLDFVQRLLGGDDQGLVALPGADFSAVAIDDVLGPHSRSPAAAAAGQLRIAPPPPPLRTPAVRALEHAERYPLHINARINALTIILNAHEKMLFHEEVEPVLKEHGFAVSEGFYYHIFFSRARWGTVFASQQYLWVSS